DLPGWLLGGYLPMREGAEEGRVNDSFFVYFYTSESPPRIAYMARVNPHAKPTLEAFSPPRACDLALAELVRARQIALAVMPTLGQPVNLIPLPGDASGESGTLVYLLAGTTKSNVVVFGQHFRAVVPPSGSGAPSMMALSHSALELPTRQSNGEAPVALMVTHVMTDYPMETHVFNSLLARLPLYVGTRRGVWYVDGDAISLISGPPPVGLA
ncbi:MAG: hypothetical protein ABI134_27370, partial [Byssovorax sp.]